MKVVGTKQSRDIFLSTPLLSTSAVERNTGCRREDGWSDCGKRNLKDILEGAWISTSDQEWMEQVGLTETYRTPYLTQLLLHGSVHSGTKLSDSICMMHPAKISSQIPRQTGDSWELGQWRMERKLVNGIGALSQSDRNVWELARHKFAQHL